MRQAQVLSDSDVKRVLAAIAKRTYAHRDRAMFMLSLLAGMRVGEIAALKVSDAYEANGSAKAQIRLSKHQTKGGKLNIPNVPPASGLVVSFSPQ